MTGSSSSSKGPILFRLPGLSCTHESPRWKPAPAKAHSKSFTRTNRLEPLVKEPFFLDVKKFVHMFIQLDLEEQDLAIKFLTRYFTGPDEFDTTSHRERSRTRKPRNSTDDRSISVHSIYTPAPERHLFKRFVAPMIYVDASARGIGVSIGVECLSWEFNYAHHLLPCNKIGSVICVDIAWAELVAVEVGLRTAVAMGYHNAVIPLSSDNKGVVFAMKERSWEWIGRLHVVMTRINELCDRHNLHPEVHYIRTSENPADDPSRGKNDRLYGEIKVKPRLSRSLSRLLFPSTLEPRPQDDQQKCRAQLNNSIQPVQRKSPLVAQRPALIKVL